VWRVTAPGAFEALAPSSSGRFGTGAKIACTALVWHLPPRANQGIFTTEGDRAVVWCLRCWRQASHTDPHQGIGGSLRRLRAITCLSESARTRQGDRPCDSGCTTRPAQPCIQNILIPLLPVCQEKIRAKPLDSPALLYGNRCCHRPPSAQFPSAAHGPSFY
jgi:hypothetical protein